VVGHASRQEQRRQQHLARESPASYTALAATGRAAARQEYGGHADAEAAAARLRALQSAYHWVQVGVEERPQSGPGRPSLQPPRVVNARRYGLPVARHARAAVIARTGQETGCVVRLTNGPPQGAMAQSASEVLGADTEPPAVEQNGALLNDPRLVTSLFLKKPERSEAVGSV
jgi:hypothetical protein